MIYTFEEIQQIVLKNPNKEIIDKGVKMYNSLMLHVHGVGMESAIKQCDEFANAQIYKVQKDYAVSNVDLFSRLLQQEKMVFMARGGSVYFGLSDEGEKSIAGILDDVHFGLPLRKWVETFALQAYRCDPMAVIFMEVDQLQNNHGDIQMPRAYPTYKSINNIYDYLPNGRMLEYICFKLTVGEAKDFGIIDDDFKNQKDEAKSSYYRFVDDAKDLIVKKDGDKVIMAPKITQQNPLPNIWKKTPAIIASDLMKFNEPKCFFSPLHVITELADTFLFDRSVRDLQKKLHGFAKAIEPLLICPTCHGDGLVSGNACKDCSTPGADKGSGYKLRTRVSDVAKFPLDILEKTSFDFSKIFGYVTPDIKGWEKQDQSLEDLEELMEMSYWGTIRMRRPEPGNGEAITASENNSNQAPKEARLNMLADWAERTERVIAAFIAQYWYPKEFKKASVNYGRDYILRSADELMVNYQEMRTKGAPDFALDEALEKYYQAKYQNNPAMLQKYLKMLDVEPFPHITLAQAKTLITDFNEYNQKLYFGEWANTIVDALWIRMPATELKMKLKEYVTAKQLTEPKPVGNPILS